MTNDVEIRIASLRRSGHHAIINWIISQAIEVRLNENESPIGIDRELSKAPAVFLNQVKPGENPFMSYHSTNHLTISDVCRRGMTEKWLGLDKAWLLYNYEDADLENIFTDDFETRHDQILGVSNVRFDMLIIRDPYNLFASRMQKPSRFKVKLSANRERIVNLWKSHAYEYLEISNHRRHNKVAVNFNQWFVDKEYRGRLAKILGLTFSDAGFQSVTSYGGGSSFDGTNYHGKAHQMPVLERWREFATNPEYLGIFVDRELRDLSSRIFGEACGVQSLFHR